MHGIEHHDSGGWFVFIGLAIVWQGSSIWATKFLEQYMPIWLAAVLSYSIILIILVIIGKAIVNSHNEDNSE